jgi:hypothetical protein
VFQVTPQPFIGVEFRRVRWEKLEGDPLVILFDKPSHCDGPVGVDVVPNQDDSSAHMTQEMSKEDQDLLCRDRPGSHQDVEPSFVADPRDRRELRPAIAVADHGCLSSWGPSPDSGRDQTETGLVGENQRGFLLAGFFLIRGQSFLIQRSTAASSRSIARPVGRW